MATAELRELTRVFDGLQRVGNRQYKVHLRYAFDLLKNTPRFWSIFEGLRAATAEFDVDAWMNEKVFAAKQTCHEWPASDSDKLRVLLRIMEVCATDARAEPTAVGRIFTYGRDMDEWAQAVTEHVVLPLVQYLQSRIDTQSEVLHHLQRMRRQVEWFEQQALYDAYSASTGKGEEIYDRRVREFLFAEGIDYPFSQPASASGKADIVAGLEGDDPLVCEIKLYDGDSYGAAYLRQGLVQAVRYAKDYAKPTAHLVVFNVSEDRVQLPTDGPPEEQPPRLVIDGVTVFLLVVQARPVPAASKDRGRQVRELRRDQLVLVPSSP